MWTHVSLHNISNLWVEMVKLGVSFHCIILFTVWIDCASVLHYLQNLTSAKFIMNLCLTWCCEPRLDVWFCVGWQCLDWLCVNSQWTQQAFMVHKCMTIKKWMCFTFTTDYRYLNPTFLSWIWTTVCVFFRHWEAIKKWDEAIQLTPDNPLLYEMKSQVYH